MYIFFFLNIYIYALHSFIAILLLYHFSLDITNKFSENTVPLDVTIALGPYNELYYDKQNMLCFDE